MFCAYASAPKKQENSKKKHHAAARQFSGSLPNAGAVLNILNKNRLFFILKNSFL
jgi:hypothetical protein